MNNNIQLIASMTFALLLISVIALGVIFLFVTPPGFSEEADKKETIYHEVSRNITIKEFFNYMDSLVKEYDSLGYPMSEHLIVHTNNWIIDTLENTDYYIIKEKGVFNYNQTSLVVLHQGDSLIIPDSNQVRVLLDKQSKTSINLNIPEFVIRIYEDKKELYAFPVRVGKNSTRYLKSVNRYVDMRTRKGKGKIIRINKNATFINPRNNKRYFTTLRDDNMRTLVPLFPWLETEINGIRNGQLIHATTNPKTLGKAYSNGCVGMKEADVWRLYYHAPLGTKVVFRYDLKIKNEIGKDSLLRDIYKHKFHRYDSTSIAMKYLLPLEVSTLEKLSVALPDPVGPNKIFLSD